MARDIYILAGQSNMMGRGIMSLAPPNYANQSRIFAYYHTAAGVDGWGAGADPLHHDDALAGVGPGMAFADRLLTLLADPTREVGLVPAAVGGTSIAQWGPTWATGSLYGKMLTLAVAASAAGPIKGLIWYQGEADSKTVANGAWRKLVRELIAAVRDDLGLPSLPVIITKIGPDPRRADYPGWSSMLVNQAQIAAIAPPHVAVVSATDLATNPGDPVHLNTASQVTLGHRYADAMFAML